MRLEFFLEVKSEWLEVKIYWWDLSLHDPACPNWISIKVSAEKVWRFHVDRSCFRKFAIYVKNLFRKLNVQATSVVARLDEWMDEVKQVYRLIMGKNNEKKSGTNTASRHRDTEALRDGSIGSARKFIDVFVDLHRLLKGNLSVIFRLVLETSSSKKLKVFFCEFLVN